MGLFLFFIFFLRVEINLSNEKWRSPALFIFLFFFSLFNSPFHFSIPPPAGIPLARGRPPPGQQKRFPQQAVPSPQRATIPAPIPGPQQAVPIPSPIRAQPRPRSPPQAVPQNATIPAPVQAQGARPVPQQASSIPVPMQAIPSPQRVQAIPSPIQSGAQGVRPVPQQQASTIPIPQQARPQNRSPLHRNSPQHQQGSPSRSPQHPTQALPRYQSQLPQSPSSLQPKAAALPRNKSDLVPGSAKLVQPLNSPVPGEIILPGNEEIKVLMTDLEKVFFCFLSFLFFF